MSEEQVSTAELVDAAEEENLDRTERATSNEVPESWQEVLLSGEEIDELQSRWNSIQIEFVDEPHTSVEQADALVAEVMSRITQMFSEKRAILDEQWANQENVSTEDLRIALQSYRSFFNRLLAL